MVKEYLHFVHLPMGFLYCFGRCVTRFPINFVAAQGDLWAVRWGFAVKAVWFYILEAKVAFVNRQWQCHFQESRWPAVRMGPACEQPSTVAIAVKKKNCLKKNLPRIARCVYCVTNTVNRETGELSNPDKWRNQSLLSKPFKDNETERVTDCSVRHSEKRMCKKKLLFFTFFFLDSYTSIN